MAVDVKGKVVLVTGANRGIGKAILTTAIDRGAKKVYAAVRKIDSAADLVKAHGDKVVPVKLDLEEPRTIAEAAEKANDVEIVVNNAGVLRTAGPLSSDAIDSLQYEQNINVCGLIRMAQAFAPVLKSNGGGAFAQLNSVASLKAFPDFATYCASKAASYSITQSLKEKLGEQGTQVVSVHPGPIATDMADAAGLGDDAEPPELVADALFDALKNGDFHAFPDSLAKQIGTAYSGFAKEVIEAPMQEA